jgi:hypothetical protein
MPLADDRIDHVVLNCRDPDGDLLEVAGYRKPD